MKNGFSLLELLLVLSLIALTTGFLFPFFIHFFNHAKMETLSTELIRAINLTREEAISRGIKVRLEKNAASYVIRNDQEIFYAFKEFSSLHFHAALGYNFLEFSPQGMPISDGCFWFCENGNPVSAIFVNEAGRTRLVYARDNKIFDSRGHELRCEGYF